LERSGRYDKIGFVSCGEFRFGCDRFARSIIGDFPEIGSVFESWGARWARFSRGYPLGLVSV